MQLIDKTIIVTGASSGIGAAAALMLAGEGANVVLGARRETLLDQLVGKINQGNGYAVSLPGDIRASATERQNRQGWTSTWQRLHSPWSGFREQRQFPTCPSP